MTAKDEITPIDSRNPVMAAMMFLAALAYPESHPKRTRAVKAMLVRLYRDARKAGHPIGRSDAANQLIAAIKVQQQTNTLRQTGNRLDKRVLQAEVALRLLASVRRPGPPVRIHPDVRKQTRDWLMRAGFSMDSADKHAARVSKDGGAPYSLNEYGNAHGGKSAFKRDVWRMDVLHLALVYRSARKQWERQHQLVMTDFMQLVASPEWVIPALQTAEKKLSGMRRAINLPPALERMRNARAIRLIPDC